MTDAGLKHFEALNNLRYIYFLGEGNISDAGIAELRKALPNCKIKR
jgi:hypothetical protein